jgi:hypothetical protein
MSQNQNIQLSIDAAHKLIAQGEAMERLLNNADFAEIVGQVYYKDEPARLAGLLGDIGGSYRWCPENTAMSLPPEQFVKMKGDIERDIHAIGAFQAFVRIVLWKADGAKQALEELEAAKNAPLDTDGGDTTDFPEA